MPQQVVSLSTLCAGTSLLSSGSIWSSIAGYRLYWHLLPYQSHLGGSTRLLRAVSVDTVVLALRQELTFTAFNTYLSCAPPHRLQCPPCTPCPHQLLQSIWCDTPWSHTPRAIYISCRCPGNIPSSLDWLTGAYGSWQALGCCSGVPEHRWFCCR